MDLTGIFKEGSLDRMDKVRDGSVFETGTMDFSFGTDAQQPVAKKAGDNDAVLLSHVHGLLCRGVVGSDLVAQIRKDMPSLSKKAWQRVSTDNGLVGTVLADCSAVNSTNELATLTAGSRFKRMAQFAVRCECGCTKRISSTEKQVMTGNALDDAFHSPVENTTNIAFCKKLNLPVLSTPREYTVAHATPVLEELIRAGLLTVKEAKTLLVQEKMPLLAVKRAFLLAVEQHKQAGKDKYAAPVDNKEFQITTVGMTAVVGKKAQAGIDVDPSMSAITAEVNAPTKKVGKVQIGDAESKNLQVSVDAGAKKALNVNMGRAESKQLQVSVNANTAKAQLSVNPTASSTVIIDDNKAKASLHIEATANTTVELSKKAKKQRAVEIARDHDDFELGLCDLPNDMLDVDADPANLELELEQSMLRPELEVDREENIDTEWYGGVGEDPIDIPVTDFETLDVDGSGSFDFDEKNG